jgi:hypothetical protein
MNQNHPIIASSYERLRETHEQNIRQMVSAKYAERWTSASWFARLYLKFNIWREIRQELDKVAPCRGLYAQK